MTWEIALGIFALAAFLISFGSIISKNSKAMTELRCSIDKINETIDKSDKRNDESHDRIYKRLDGHDEAIEKHDMRIHDLEREHQREMK